MWIMHRRAGKHLCVGECAGDTGSHIDWATEAPRYAAQMASQLETRFGLADFRQNIVVQHILTPHDLAQLYQAPGGSIYGLASNTTLSAFMRPTQRDPQIAGLYYCGGGTHPGGASRWHCCRVSMRHSL
jgi:phytoene dehydrogenase-like protein